MEEAMGYQELMQQHGYTQEQVAKSVHLDRSSISKIVDRYLKDSHNSQNAQL